MIVDRVWIWKPLKTLALRLWSQVHGTIIRHDGSLKSCGMIEGVPVAEVMLVRIMKFRSQVSSLSCEPGPEVALLPYRCTVLP